MQSVGEEIPETNEAISQTSSKFHPNWSRRQNCDTSSKFQWTLPPPHLETVDSPHTLFEKFFTPELMQNICNESETYATSMGRTGFKIDVPEMRVFLAILLISGYVKLSRRPMYWENSKDVHNEGVSSAMSRKRFCEIMRNLHLADNSRLDKKDKFAKVRPLIDYINCQCQKHFIPEQTISIDESMIPYYGKHGSKQYIRGKQIKFGFKVWVAATPLGYVIQMDPYQGAAANMKKELGLGGTVVTFLASKLPKIPNQNYHLLFDNFFTSPQLLKTLADNGFAATGTLRANRTLHAPLKDEATMKKMDRGSYDHVRDHDSGIHLIRWKDNRVVTVASTFTGVAPLTHTNRFSRERKERIRIPQPQAVAVYNKGMGGVDRFDENVAAYMIDHRSKKWWWPLFRYCVDLGKSSTCT